MATDTPAAGIRPPSAMHLVVDPALTEHPSPNCGPRRDGLTPQLIVLHYTAMPTANAALERLCDPATEVSAHYLICKTGAITRMVAENDRAWHAGAGEWNGQSDINSRSIGIELDNDGQSPFASPLMTALETLLPAIMQRWSIPPSGIIAHSDMAPGRKSDPGAKFDWARLARQGLAAPSGPENDLTDPTPEGFRHRARAAGYTADVDDATLLAAVRLRHRAHASGRLSAHDIAALPLA